jgi:succinate-semialdehyde dehydrogenase/glutarate-semialdehyde dehydrogenase
MNLSKHIDSASDAFKDWKKVPFEDRQKLLINLADVLEKNKEKFAKTITTEMHKPISQLLLKLKKVRNDKILCSRRKYSET